MSSVLKGTDCGTNEKPTDHHNIPRSRGGTDRKNNISDVPVDRHVAFHSWAANRDPTQLIRQIALHSLGMKDKSVGMKSMYALLRTTKPKQWPDCYKEGALHSIFSMYELGRDGLMQQEHFQTQLLEEIVWTRQTVEALTMGSTFPVQDHLLLPKAMEFFNTGSPREVINGILNEKNDNRERLWTKALKREARKDIAAALVDPDEFITRPIQPERMLRKHASSLEGYQRNLRDMWKRVLERAAPSGADEAAA